MISRRIPTSIQQGCVVGLTLLTLGAGAKDFADPAPPEVREIPANTASPEAGPFDRLVSHPEPKPLASDAVTADWPRFLGPNDDGTSPETHLLDAFPEGGLRKVWEVEKGSGYTSAIVGEGRLVLFDRIGDEETVDCLDPATGERFWHYGYPVVYTDRYGFSDGPRASAVIVAGEGEGDRDKVYTLGVTSTLTCLDLATGTPLWQRRLADEFELASYFFGHGSCPLVHGGKVIVPLGTDDNLSVAAFDRHTGELVWGTEHEWNAGYASPVVVPLQGKPRLLVFGGGESDPPAGGLMAIDPDTGELLDAFPWRADKYESVNGSTPVAVGDDRVYISDAYQIGGVLLELTPELEWREVWRAPGFGLHWTTPLHLDGHLYGFPGRNEPDASLASYDALTGEENWRADPEWTLELDSGRDYRMRYFRGSFLHADGKAYALGELGSLGILQLSPERFEELDRTQLFLARATWSSPVVHRGLLYISQHEPAMDGTSPRLICYDLRTE
ncbi:MAG: PQQ-binding-like beta-propeller repeat protein [Verrucomicrobiales bacterium]